MFAFVCYHAVNLLVLSMANVENKVTNDFYLITTLFLLYMGKKHFVEKRYYYCGCFLAYRHSVIYYHYSLLI